MRRLVALCLLLLALARLAAAQGSGPFDFVPEKWHPMALGDAWYRYDNQNCGLSIDTRWVDRVVADTTVGGRRWARIKTVSATTTTPCRPNYDNWWSFTPDHYLVRTLHGSRPGSGAWLDTLLKTRDRSVFTARSANEPFENADQCPGRTTTANVQPAYDEQIVHWHTERGSTQDSTNFMLSVNRGRYLCEGDYFYKIGPAYNLKGAIVGGIRWGDADYIERTVDAEREPARAGASVAVYPNPSRGVLWVRAEAGATPRRLRVYDALGRLAFEQAAGVGPTALDVRGRLSPGAYVLLVLEGGRSVARTPFVLAE